MNANRLVNCCVLICLFSVRLPASAGAEEQQSVSFSRDIRPILSSKCFSCHGPDSAAREADLRLDRYDEATADRGGYAALIPGKPQESEAFQRLVADDPDVRMPPAEAKKDLSEEEIQLLRRWIEQGAEYEPHWAFVPPQRTLLPAVELSDWPQNEIDHFVLAQLEQQGLQPSAEADMTTLMRRVSLDLIGLAPTPDELDAFLQAVQGDGLETAYTDLVDRLLASKHYGQRWARRWLDLARYADTNGYEKDRTRDIWAYRDWVIDALNDDMPFDQFTIAQLAGDLLPDASIEDRIATGFHRNTMLNEEGGIDPLEFRFYAMTDRVATTGTTWLGLTLGCAQCHSHKFDPISQQDYYQLMAYLNNADEPELDLPDPVAAEQHRAGLAEAQRLLDELPNKWPPENVESEQHRFEQWLVEQRERVVRWQVLRPTEATSNLPLLTVEDDDSVFASGDTTKSDRYQLRFEPAADVITAIRLEALPDARLPAHGPGMTYYEGTKGDFFLGEFQLTADGKTVRLASASHSYAKNRFGSNPVSAVLATDDDPQTGWSVDGRLGERHAAVFLPEQPLRDVGELEVTMLFGRHFASSLGRFRISVSSDPGGSQALDIPAPVQALLLRSDRELTDVQRQRLREEFLLTAPELSEASGRIRQLREPSTHPTTLVLQERAENNPRPTYIHRRGEYLSRTEQVQPSVPESLHAFLPGQPQNRLGFARWLVARNNPLTARVVVNRAWAGFLGRGIVRTTGDFGLQGELPTHPALLDWLAIELMERGWSQKQLHRMIVTSATYRQSSHVTSDRLQADPDNRWLSRAPRLRLDAEVLRDSALRASGSLSEKMGGPGVRPAQPEGVTEVAYGSPSWQPSEGEDRYRRSIYTFLKRTAPFAMFATFDAPSGEACTARRDVSNTPLQALTLLNDVMFVEASQALGRLVIRRADKDPARIRLMFRRILTRPPNAEESMLLGDFVRRQRERFAESQTAASQLAGDDLEDVCEQAAWTALARALFSLDEAVTRN